MPAPTSYSEGSLLEFMLVELGATGVSLGLVANDDPLAQAVTAVERLLGVSDVANATDLALLEAAARWQAWLAAEAAAASQFNVTLTGGKKFEREQIFQNIQTRRTDAYGFYLLEKARASAATGTGVFAFGLASGRRGL
jgi:hypothetical protein